MYSSNFFDYCVGRMVEMLSNHFDWPFYAIVQTLMRRANDKNLEMLKGCWPEVYEDLKKRYNAPGGMLTHERDDPAKAAQLMDMQSKIFASAEKIMERGKT